jgi:hypothetical protein
MQPIKYKYSNNTQIRRDVSECSFKLDWDYIGF